MNNTDWDEVTVIGCCVRPPERKGGKCGPCRHHYYAVRDAIAGEELLISYGEFETTIARYETSWRGRRTLP